MATYFLWGGIGLLLLFLVLGLVSGLTRGLKRATVHLAFLLVSFLIAFFITKPITSTLLGISLPINGKPTALRDILISMLNINVETYPESSQFLSSLPTAIISPIAFIIVALLTWLVVEIIYLIFARIVLGKKKKDFAEHKPYRWFGGLIGVVEGFIFMFVLFAPLTALTKTYSTLSTLPKQEIQSTAETSSGLKTIPEYIHEFIPKEVDEIIISYKNSVIGVTTGVGNFDNAMFDGLSNFKFQGQKISVRSELIAVADTFNEFVDVYNQVNAKNYPNTIADLNKKFDKVLKNGIFKAVVPSFIKEYLKSADISKAELPDILKNILTELKDNADFKENKKIYEFLSHDISKILEAADDALSTGLVKDIVDVKSTGTDKILDILKVINTKNNDASLSKKPTEIIGEVFDLKLLEYCSEPILTYASTQVNEMLKDAQKDIEFGINTEISSSDMKDTLDSVLEVIKEIQNCDIDIFSLIQSKDILQELNSLSEEELSNGLDTIGSVLDKTRALKILNFKDSKGQEQNLFDNLLKSKDLEILKDDVIDGMGKDGKFDETLKDGKLTYAEFFAYIKTPALEAKSAGLLNINEQSFDFNAALDKILTNIKTKENYIASIILPFKNLTALNLNETVFNQVINVLEEQLGLLDFTNIKDSEDSVWQSEFAHLENLLNMLNDENHKIDDKTFIKYLIEQDPDKKPDMQALLKEIKKSNILDNLIDQVFEGKIFRPLVNKMFDAIDTAIAEVTKINPQSNLAEYDNAKYEAQKPQICTIIKGILNIALVEDGQQLSIVEVGKILDLLKVNAWQNGQKDGVFNPLFENIIWYLTGENIGNNPLYINKETQEALKPETNDYYKDAKVYIENIEGFTNYYQLTTTGDKTYTSVMQEVQDMVDLATKLGDSLSGIGDLNTDNAEEFADKLSGVVNEMLEDKQPEEVKDIIDNLGGLIDENADREGVLDEFLGGDGLQEDEKKAMSDKIDELVGSNEDTEEGRKKQELAEALKDLLGLNPKP